MEPKVGVILKGSILEVVIKLKDICSRFQIGEASKIFF